MMNRVGLRAAQQVSRRNFSTSMIARSGPEGPYSNLPFKVHGRKIVPYWAIHWSFFVVGLGTPFAMVYYQLKKSGSV